jgi:hypothetical protein
MPKSRTRTIVIQWANPIAYVITVIAVAIALSTVHETAVQNRDLIKRVQVDSANHDRVECDLLQSRWDLLHQIVLNETNLVPLTAFPPGSDVHRFIMLINKDRAARRYADLVLLGPRSACPPSR